MSDHGLTPAERREVERVREVNNRRLEPGWASKRGKYIHHPGCSCDAGDPCTCEPPYPKPKLTGLDPAALERAAKAVERVMVVSYGAERNTEENLRAARRMSKAAIEASGYPSVVAEQQQELNRGEAHREELQRDVEAWRARVHTLEEALEEIAERSSSNWWAVSRAREALSTEAGWDS